MTLITSPIAVRPWLAQGARVTDTNTTRTGHIQLLQDELGVVRTHGMNRPARALLRPKTGEPWWAPVSALEPAGLAAA